MAARKNAEEQMSMIDTFKEFKDTKNIDRTTLVSVLEESFRNVLAKIYGSDENFDVIVNPDKGTLKSIATAWSWLTARWLTRIRRSVSRRRRR